MIASSVPKEALKLAEWPLMQINEAKKIVKTRSAVQSFTELYNTLFVV